MQAVATPKPKVDVKWITPFVDAIRSVFKTMANIDTQILKPCLKTNAGQSNYNVFGIIGFSGQLTGSVTLSFTTAAACKLAEAFTSEPIEPNSPHFADAIGELANMIAGSAKSKLGYDARISVPSVIIGEQCHIATLSDVPCIVIPCTSPAGDFAVEVCIKQQAA